MKNFYANYRKLRKAIVFTIVLCMCIGYSPQSQNMTYVSHVFPHISKPDTDSVKQVPVQKNVTTENPVSGNTFQKKIIETPTYKSTTVSKKALLKPVSPANDSFNKKTNSDSMDEKSIIVKPRVK